MLISIKNRKGIGLFKEEEDLNRAKESEMEQRKKGEEVGVLLEFYLRIYVVLAQRWASEHLPVEQ